MIRPFSKSVLALSSGWPILLCISLIAAGCSSSDTKAPISSTNSGTSKDSIPDDQLSEPADEIKDDSSKPEIMSTEPSELKQLETKPVTSKMGWTLHMTDHASVNGVLYTSPEGTKLEDSNLETGYLVKPPDWKVVRYNNKTQVYCETTQEEFQKKKNQDQRDLATKSPPFIKGVKGHIAGLSATQYCQNPDSKDSRTTEMWLTEDVKVPILALQAVQSTHGLPSKGVLLRMIVTNDDGTKTTILDTENCIRGAIPTSTFSLPNFRKVESDWDVN